MKKEKEIIEEIFNIEKHLFDEECYLNEHEQYRITTLYQTLNRKLNDKEKEIVYKMRLDFMEECLGEKIEEILNKKMFYEF
jgi:hypothetical protein